MKRLVAAWVWVLVLAPAWTAAAAGSVELVRAGEPVAAIVVPEGVLPAVRLAADELQHHVRKATGAELPILVEGRADLDRWGHAVYLGDTRAAREAGIDAAAMGRFEGVVRAQPKALILAGRDEAGDVIGSALIGAVNVSCGTLFAVYDFLETDLGVRWLWPGDLGEVVPERADIAISEVSRETGPVLEQAVFRMGWRSPKNVLWRSSFAPQFYDAQRLWLCRQRYAFKTYLGYQHSFQGYWDRYGTSKPEFFNQLPDGTRRPLPPKGFWKQLERENPQFYAAFADGIDQPLPDYPIDSYQAVNVTLCVSNPDLHRHIVDQYRDRFDPAAGRLEPGNLLVLCDNDSPGLCTGEACRAWDAPDPRFDEHPYWLGKHVPEVTDRFPFLRAGDSGEANRPSPSLSDRYARFYLAVQEEAEKYLPGATVFGYAYANYSEPPRQVKLNERVIISFVGWPKFPFNADRLAAARAQWDAWRAAGVRMVLRPNSTHSGHNLPISFGRALGAELQHAARNGLIGTDFDALTGQWGTQGPSLYTLARLQIEPERPIDDILGEYYDAFGGAASQVRAYFDHWDAVSAAVTSDEYARYLELRPGAGGSERWLWIADLVFTRSVMERGRALLDDAVAASQGDPVAQARVDFLVKGYTNARMTLDVLRLHNEFKASETKANRERFERAQDRLRAYRDSIERDHIADMGYLYYLEQYHTGWWRGFPWDAAVEKRPQAGSPSPVLRARRAESASPAQQAGYAADLVPIAGGRYDLHGRFMDPRPQTVAGFRIGRHEVTWGQWRPVRDWAVTRGYDLDAVGEGCADDHPVHSVSWFDAVKWCNARSEMEGLTPVYTLGGDVYRSGRGRDVKPEQDLTADGYRLPLNAEWELAAIGGSGERRHTYAGSDDLHAVGWYRDNSTAADCDLGGGRGTRPVGTKQPNGLGLHDMSGNVWEWCWEAGTSMSFARHLRGGSFADYSSRADVTNWVQTHPENRYPTVGFRVARSDPGAPDP